MHEAVPMVIRSDWGDGMKLGRWENFTSPNKTQQKKEKKDYLCLCRITERDTGDKKFKAFGHMIQMRNSG